MLLDAGIKDYGGHAEVAQYPNSMYIVMKGSCLLLSEQELAGKKSPGKSLMQSWTRRLLQSTCSGS